MRIDKYGRTIASHLVYMSVQEKEILRAAAKDAKQSLSGYIVGRALAASKDYAKGMRYDPKMEEKK